MRAPPDAPWLTLQGVVPWVRTFAGGQQKLDAKMSPNQMATRCRSIVAAFIGVLAVSMHAQQPSTARPQTSDDGFRFKSGIEVINVTATVSDASGRFVSGLQSEDFSVYEDDRLVP